MRVAADCGPPGEEPWAPAGTVEGAPRRAAPRGWMQGSGQCLSQMTQEEDQFGAMAAPTDPLFLSRAPPLRSTRALRAAIGLGRGPAGRSAERRRLLDTAIALHKRALAFRIVHPITDPVGTVLELILHIQASRRVV